MRVIVALAALVAGESVAAADASWTLAIVGGRELTFRSPQTASEVPLMDVSAIAADLDLIVDVRDGQAVIRDRAGAEWRVAHGSVLLEGPVGAQPLVSPAVLAGRSVLLPLDAIAQLAGRSLVVDGRRALLLPASPQSTGDRRAPAGWTRVQIAKTPAELAETRRLEATDAAGEQPLAAVAEVLPPAHDQMMYDVGLGFAQGASGAVELRASGAASGVHLTFHAFATYGRDGATYRSGRLVAQDAGAKWSLEAGDLVSDVRGLVRGIRVGRTVGGRWRPSVGLYLRSQALSLVDGSVVAYRDDLQLPADVGVRVEATSDGSSLVGVRWLRGRLSGDAFLRHVPSRSSEDRGAAMSYDIWRGLTVQLGARFSTGPVKERWYSAAVSVPIANRAVATIERSRSQLTPSATNAVGVQLPVGRLRVMQRFQWTDVALVRESPRPGIGSRQLQSMASYTLARRVQLSYQLATQWTATTAVRQWTELQTVFTISRATSLHVVTGLPDLANPQRFRMGLQQSLGRGFRLAVDYGRLPAFQTPVRHGVTEERSRFLVMVRRGFARATPAGGRTVRGRVVDPRGQPVAGAVVTLGPYVTRAASDGAYQIRHVPDGEFDLALDPSRLPAQYAPDGVRQRLVLAGRGDVARDLQAIPLYTIQGHIYVDGNGNGAYDPGEGVANVVMRLSSDGRATKTDGEGTYSFYNVRPGRYVVRIDVDRLARDIVVVGTGVAEVEVNADGRARTGVDLTVTPREKPVRLQGTRWP